MADWKIVVDIEGKNPGDAKEDDESQGINQGGFVIFAQLGDGYGRREVSRVAFIRRNSANPDVSFAEQLGIEMTKAKEAVAAANELFANAGTLQ